jgi:hypothetical protein
VFAAAGRTGRVRSKDDVTEGALFYQEMMLLDASLLSFGWEECGEHILDLSFLGYGQLGERNRCTMAMLRGAVKEALNQLR